MRKKALMIIFAVAKIVAIFFVVSIGMSSIIFAQSEKKVINIFKTKIDSLENCLTNVNWLIKDIKYDVKKTKSLIIPIQGEVEFSAMIRDKIDIPNNNVFPVLLNLYWSADNKKWVLEKLLSKYPWDTGWREPEKDKGWHKSDGPGFLMEDLLIALRHHFSSK